MADGLPIFFTDKEEALMIRYGRELVERFINQHVILYSISVKNTESNFYGEAKHKFYDKKVELKCRVEIADDDIYSEGGVRRTSKSDMNCWVYNEHLVEKEVTLKVGDFIGYAGKFYEIYDAGIEKDSLDRKLGGDREYYTKVLAKVVTPDIFKSIEGNI